MVSVWAEQAIFGIGILLTNGIPILVAAAHGFDVAVDQHLDARIAPP